MLKDTTASNEPAREVDFQTALSCASEGSEEHVTYLIEHYGKHIHRVVRRRLDMRLRSKFDSLDFVQMVWASFFRENDRLNRFETPEQLIRFLVTLARNKVIDEERRRLWGEKYNVSNEQSYDQLGTNEQELETPSQVAIAREKWDLMLSSESKRDREILQLRMSGSSYQEIAEQLGMHERTVRRIVGRITGPQKSDD